MGNTNTDTDTNTDLDTDPNTNTNTGLETLRRGWRGPILTVVVLW